MITRSTFQGVRATAVALAILTGGCDSGDGHGTERVFFSMSNYEGCTVAFTTLKLGSPDSELVRNGDGSADCTLTPELASAGCTMSFEENSEAETLRIAVSGCRVPTLSNLFSCEYRKAAMNVLNTEEGATCGCLSYPESCYVNGVCDLCASQDANRAGCENCSNNTDDDGDGFADCDDDDCELTSECGYGRSTLPCPSTTVTTTSTTVTTPVLPANGEVSGSRD